MDMTLDTLNIVKRLKEASFTEVQAEAVANVIRDQHKDYVAGMVTREYLNGQLETLKRDMNAQMEILKRDMTIRLGTLIVALGGYLSVIKFFG